MCLIVLFARPFRVTSFGTNILHIAAGLGASSQTEDAMRTQLPFALLAITLACSLASPPAHARARVFVASYGNDSNPCTFGSPCRNFQQAVTVVDPGGEVTAIDSAGFGPVTSAAK